MFPPLSLQLSQLMNKIESEISGNVKLVELHEAVDYAVAFFKLRPSSANELSDGDFLNGYVGADRNGGVEFAEFLATTMNPNEDFQQIAVRRQRLHIAFNEFCNLIRRRKISEKISNSNCSDLDKLYSMVDLFGINYFQSNSFEEQLARQNRGRKIVVRKDSSENIDATDIVNTAKVTKNKSTAIGKHIITKERKNNVPIDVNYANKITKSNSNFNCNAVADANSGLRNYKEENSILLKRQRRAEIIRARDASLYLGTSSSSYHQTVGGSSKHNHCGGLTTASSSSSHHYHSPSTLRSHSNDDATEQLYKFLEYKGDLLPLHNKEPK